MIYKNLCKTAELIENYEKAAADNFNGWDCHHRLETHFSDGTPRPKKAQLSAKELKALDMYFDRPPEELIFLTHGEHSSLHNSKRILTNITKEKISKSGKGKHSQPKSEEWKRKISKAHKGRPSPRKGLHYSEEEKERLYASRRGPNPNMRRSTPANARKIICVETGVIYNSVASAVRETGINRLNYWIKKNKTCKNGLTYQYLDDYTSKKEGE